MSDLRPEYQKIVDEVCATPFESMRRVITLTAEKCQKLPNKPVKRLSDEQIRHITNYGYTWIQTARAIEEAHIKLQQEPEELPFDFDRWKNEGGWGAIDAYGKPHYEMIERRMEYKFMRRKS